MKCRNEIYELIELIDRLDEKNGAICLVNMFTPRDFCIFCWGQQISVTDWVKYISAFERSYLVISENARSQTLKIKGFGFLFLPIFLIFLPPISHER